MEDITNNAFQVLHEFLVENKLTWIYFVVIIINLFTIGVTWFFVTKKSTREIKKLESEVKKLDSEVKKNNLESQEKIVSIFEKLNSYAEKYKLKSKEFQDILIEFSEIKDSEDRKKIKQTYRNLTRVFLSEVVDSFVTYFKIYRDIYKHDEDKKREFTNFELIPFIETSSEFLLVINSQEIVQLVDGEYFQISKTLFTPIIEFAINNSPIEREKVLIEVGNSIYQNTG